MAVETITIGDLVDRITFEVRHDTLPGSALRSHILWYLDGAVSDFLNEFDHPAFQADATISVVSGTADYDLADDFQRLIDGTVRYTTGGLETLQRLTEAQWHRMEQDRFFSATYDYPQWFDLVGRSATSGAQQLRLRPTPSTDSTIKYQYISTPTARDASTDDPVAIRVAADEDILDRRFPPEMHQYLVEAVLARYLAQWISSDRLQQAAAWLEKNAASLRGKAMPSIGHSHQQGAFMARRGGGQFRWNPGIIPR